MAQMAQIAPELEETLAKLRSFSAEGGDELLTQALLLARVAERNLYVRLKALPTSGPASRHVLGRKLRSPVDGKEVRVIDADCELKKFLKSFFDALNSSGHVFVLHPGNHERYMPEAVLDRLGLSVSVDLTRPLFFKLVNSLKPVLETAQLEKVQEIISQVYKENLEPTAPRLVALRRATDPKTSEFAFIHGDAADEAKKSIAVGLSQRIAFDLLLLASSCAVLAGRTEVTSEDLSSVFVLSTLHRITLTQHGQHTGFDVRGFLQRTVTAVMKVSTEQLTAASKPESGHAHGAECGCGHEHHH